MSKAIAHKPMANADEFFRYFTRFYAATPDKRIRMPAQVLRDDPNLPFHMDGNQDTIVFAYTGGTIGSVPTKDGLAPKNVKTLREFIKLRPDLLIFMKKIRKAYPHTKFAFRTIAPLDSGAMNDAQRASVPQEISDIAEDFGSRLMAIVPLHGTDSATKSAALTSNAFSDGSVGIYFASSQYAPGALGDDGTVVVIDCMKASHLNVSGTHLISDGLILHPADAVKQTDSGRQIFGPLNYGFGVAGEIDAGGGAKMMHPFAARGADASGLPFIPKDVIENIRKADLEGLFLHIADTLTAYQINRYTKEIKNGALKPDAIYIDATGTSSVTTEAGNLAEAAAERGISVVVGSLVAHSTGDSHYAAASGMNMPGILKAPGVSSPLDRRYGTIIASAYTRWICEKFGIDPNASANDPLRPHSNVKISSRQAIFSAIYTRGQRMGTKFVGSEPVLPSAGFDRLVRDVHHNSHPANG